METAICRLRQIAATIADRQKAKRTYDETLLEWQTKTISVFIASTVKVSKGKKNPLLAAAEKISLKAKKIANGKTSTKKDADSEAYNPEVFVEQGSQLADNAAGSYEAFMARAGGLPR
jgi:hypothetical protein